MISDKDTLTQLLALIRQEHQLETHSVHLGTKLVDVGLDSLAVAELLFSIEETFHVDFGNMNHEFMPVTFGDVVKLIDTLPRKH
jgi:acyl carrier protein